MGVFDRGLVKGGNDVAALEPSFFCRPILSDLGDQRARRFLEPEGLGQFGRDRLNGHAQPAARDLALVLKLGNDRLGQVNRNGKADAYVAPTLAEDRRVDPDHLTFQVK